MEDVDAEYWHLDDEVYGMLGLLDEEFKVTHTDVVVVEHCRGHQRRDSNCGSRRLIYVGVEVSLKQSLEDLRMTPFMATVSWFAVEATNASANPEPPAGWAPSRTKRQAGDPSLSPDFPYRLPLQLLQVPF